MNVGRTHSRTLLSFSLSLSFARSPPPRAGLFECDDTSRDDMQWIAALCSDALAENVTMKTIAKRLAADAIAHGSSDNTTALVLDLRPLTGASSR